jgi:hypothetical protein
MAIMDRARANARAGLWAASIVADDRETLRSAIERLDASGPVRASALETAEAADTTKLIGPLLALWEPIAPMKDRDGAWVRQALEDDDPFVRSCAAVIRARREGDTMTPTANTISLVERALILRNIPLFADLEAKDLERLAAIAEERGFEEGETIAHEGELGDAMYVVTDGAIDVVSGTAGAERVLARRSAGDVVGEMSIITRSPRMASLVAAGPVRTIRIGQREFESMVRERPDLALGVMRVLAMRLAENARATSTS